METWERSQTVHGLRAAASTSVASTAPLFAEERNTSDLVNGEDCSRGPNLRAFIVDEKEVLVRFETGHGARKLATNHDEHAVKRRRVSFLSGLYRSRDACSPRKRGELSILRWECFEAMRSIRVSSRDSLRMLDSRESLPRHCIGKREIGGDVGGAREDWRFDGSCSCVSECVAEVERLRGHREARRVERRGRVYGCLDPIEDVLRERRGGGRIEEAQRAERWRQNHSFAQARANSSLRKERSWTRGAIHTSEATRPCVSVRRTSLSMKGVLGRGRCDPSRGRNEKRSRIR